MPHGPIFLDRTGFPMLRLENGNYIHALPVTKVQLELFLCDARDGHFPRAWYEDLLPLCPRETARRLHRDNYWQAFATAILPGEAERMAAWSGEGYRLPTASEWIHAYSELRARSVADLVALLRSAGLGERARELLERLEHCLRATGVPVRGELLTAMRYGVFEWVSLEGERPGRWAALGEPNPGLHGNLLAPEKGELVLARKAETERHPAFGFRLLYQPKAAALAA